MIHIIKSDKLDINNITIEKPEKVNKHYYSKIKYDDEPLYIQTQKVINIKDLINFDTKDPYIDISVKDLKLYDKISNLEDNILNSTKENWKLWMDKDIPIDILKNMYNKLSKSFKQNEMPKYKFKIPINKSKILTKIYDDKKIDIDIKDIKENDELILILNIRGIKYNEKTFHLDIYITQIKVFNNKQNIISTECLIDSDNENGEDLIDEEELNQILKIEKLKTLNQQKREDLDLIEQIKLRINNIDLEIKNILENK